MAFDRIALDEWADAYSAVRGLGFSVQRQCDAPDELFGLEESAGESGEFLAGGKPSHRSPMKKPSWLELGFSLNNMVGTE
ncbi:hypothetical protein QF012_005960 [Pseudomonas laurylsulfatiphila]